MRKKLFRYKIRLPICAFLIHIFLLMVFLTGMLSIQAEASSATAPAFGTGNIRKSITGTEKAGKSITGTEIISTDDPMDMDREEYTIGIVTGAGSEKLVRNLFHRAKIKGFKGPTELILALEQGQADCIVYNGIVLENAQREKKETLYILKTPVGIDEICMAVSPVSKHRTLHAEVTAFMEQKKEAGYLDDVYDRWTSGNEYVMPEIPEAEDPKAVITVGTQGTVVPYSFYQGDQLIGMCIELVKTFALENGYAIEYRVEDTTSQLADAEFGRIDMTDGGMFYTPERAEQADFVFPAIHEVPTEMMVLAKNTSRRPGFWDTVRTNFEKTFIREDRWKLMLHGLRVTLLLSCCSLALGTFFSFLFCLIRRSRIRALSMAMKSVIELVNGMPIVLFLMICFYLIFSKTGLPEIAVAVIAFATDFGCRGAVTLSSGMDSVQKGEIEAAVSMGMSPFQVNRLIIFPQAVQNIFGVYKTQVVNLIKATSVVGYIAVQDLTKVSDIIRARTYEVFFSLVFTAMIYFLICRVVLLLLSLAEKRLHRKRRRKAPFPAGGGQGEENDSIKDLLPEEQKETRQGMLPEKRSEEKKDVLLEVRHLSKYYGEIIPLRDVSCTIRSGEVISVIGPSGTGKSTFLRCLNRLEIPDSGETYFSGKLMTDNKKELREARRKIGMVFQSFNLFSQMTVLENLTVGPVILNGVSRQEAEKKAAAMLESVGLAGREDYYPDELSGGQRQRVAIARTLCMDPELLLLDEPTSALDPAMIDEVHAVIRGLADRGYTMLIVTHEMRFAENVSSRIFFMSEGIIYEDGTPEEIFHHPSREKTRIFINRLKTHETIFEDPRIDYAKTVAELAAFGSRQGMGMRTLNKLMQVFEEAVYDLLMKRKEAFPVRFCVTCEENGENCEVSVFYQGEEYNPFRDEGLLEVRILKGVTKKAEHEYAGGENTLRFQL